MVVSLDPTYKAKEYIPYACGQGRLCAEDSWPSFGQSDRSTFQSDSHRTHGSMCAREQSLHSHQDYPKHQRAHEVQGIWRRHKVGTAQPSPNTGHGTAQNGEDEMFRSSLRTGLDLSH